MVQLESIDRMEFDSMNWTYIVVSIGEIRKYLLKWYFVMDIQSNVEVQEFDLVFDWMIEHPEIARLDYQIDLRTGNRKNQNLYFTNWGRQNLHHDDSMSFSYTKENQGEYKRELSITKTSTIEHRV